MYPHGRLSPQQVRTTYFIAPSFFASLALGGEGAQEYERRRALLQAQGRDLHIVGWPDGTTVLYEQAAAGMAFDVDLLLDLYNLSAAFARITDPGVA